MKPAFRPLLTAVFGLALLPGLASTAQGAEATVILSQDCEYLLLDSPQGQMLVKVIKGERPKAGDRLQGTFRQREFSELTVTRTRGVIGVWVDLIDPSATRALMRFSQYCD